MGNSNNKDVKHKEFVQAWLANSVDIDQLPKKDNWAYIKNPPLTQRQQYFQAMGIRKYK